MIIALLMGRKGSKGFPGKNLYMVSGKPLAYYPMRAATGCPEINRSYISTDDERLMELAGENRIEVIKRPATLCTDETLGEDVYLHAYNFVKDNNREQIELIALLMCNAATITSDTISEGINALRANPDYDSAVTVSRYNMWSPVRARRINKDGLLDPFVCFEAFGDPKALNCDRDSQGDVWFADMGVSIIRPRCLENIRDGLLPQKWMGKKIYPLKQWGGLDVDYEWQIPQVEYWLKKQRSYRMNILKTNKYRKRTVLVTGAASGIGKEVAIKFAKGGWNVVCHYNSSHEKAKELEGLIKTLDVECYIIRADFSCKGQLNDFLSAIKKFKIDSLINNAGTYVTAKYFTELTLEDINSTFMLNAYAPILIASSVFAQMKKENFGRIVNISSIAAKYGGSSRSMHYGCSKRALEGLTKTMGREGAEYNILVNTVRPGVIDTEFHKRFPKDIKKRISMIPLKRMGSAEDVADIVYYLGSEKNHFITREIIAVTGGE